MPMKPINTSIRFNLILLMLLGLTGQSLFAADAAQRAYQKGDYQSALRRYERTLKDHPDWEAAHFGRGAALYKTDRLDEALLEFEKAVSIKNPQQKAGVFYNIGNTLFKSGRIAESLQFYKKALELNPRDFNAKHNYELARLALQQQQQQQNQSQSKQQKEQQQQSQPQAQSLSENKAKQQQQAEAAQVLDALKNQEKQLMQERLRQQHSTFAKEKDW